MPRDIKTTDSIPVTLNGTQNTGTAIGTSKYLGNIYRESGLYDKSEIANARFKRYTRFGNALDGYGRLNNTTEYLFFTKMDLPLVDVENHPGEWVLREGIDSSDYFVYLMKFYPEVIQELQKSAPGDSDTDSTFSHLLSFCVNNSLDLPGIDSSTSIDGPSTVYGTNIEYPGNSEASDEKHSFSLEFVDSKNLELYHFFKAYQEYHIVKKGGNVYPFTKYRINRQLYDMMGVYKFLVADDMQTLIHWSYLWGVYPTSCPREAFSDPLFPDGLTYTVSFKSEFIEDMNPSILARFNRLMGPIATGKEILPIGDFGDPGASQSGTPLSTGFYTINRDLPSAAMIALAPDTETWNGKQKYKMIWYK